MDEARECVQQYGSMHLDMEGRLQTCLCVYLFEHVDVYRSLEMRRGPSTGLNATPRRPGAPHSVGSGTPRSTSSRGREARPDETNIATKMEQAKSKVEKAEILVSMRTRAETTWQAGTRLKDPQPDPYLRRLGVHELKNVESGEKLWANLRKGTPLIRHPRFDKPNDDIVRRPYEGPGYEHSRIRVNERALEAMKSALPVPGAVVVRHEAEPKPTGLRHVAEPHSAPLMLPPRDIGRGRVYAPLQIASATDVVSIPWRRDQEPAESRVHHRRLFAGERHKAHVLGGVLVDHSDSEAAIPKPGRAYVPTQNGRALSTARCRSAERRSFDVITLERRSRSADVASRVNDPFDEPQHPKPRGVRTLEAALEHHAKQPENRIVNPFVYRKAHNSTWGAHTPQDHDIFGTGQSRAATPPPQSRAQTPPPPRSASVDPAPQAAARPSTKFERSGDAILPVVPSASSGPATPRGSRTHGAQRTGPGGIHAPNTDANDPFLSSRLGRQSSPRTTLRDTARSFLLEQGTMSTESPKFYSTYSDPSGLVGFRKHRDASPQRLGSELPPKAPLLMPGGSSSTTQRETSPTRFRRLNDPSGIIGMYRSRVGSASPSRGVAAAAAAASAPLQDTSMTGRAPSPKHYSTYTDPTGLVGYRAARRQSATSVSRSASTERPSFGASTDTAAPAAQHPQRGRSTTTAAAAAGSALPAGRAHSPTLRSAGVSDVFNWY
jgi:hypothetical protein